MREVEIDIFLIAKTGACKDEIRKWLDRVGAQEYEPPYEEASLTDAEAVIGLSAKRCYMSFLADGKLNPNLTKVRTDWTEYIDNILKSGHGSVTECASWTFAIEGVSRVFCYRPNTEVLTKSGWKPVATVADGEVVLTLNPENGKARWSTNHKTHAFEYSGPLYYWKNNEDESPMVTPDHTLWCCPANMRKVRDVKAREALAKFGGKYTFQEMLGKPFFVRNSIDEIDGSKDPKTISIGCATYDAELLFEWLGWVATDGCIEREKTGRSRVRINQTKQVGVDRIEAICTTLFADALKVTGGGYKAFDISKPELRNWCMEMIGRKKENRDLSPIFAYSKRLVSAFLKGVFGGDGCHGASGHMEIACGGNESLAKQYQVLIAINGLASRAYRKAEASDTPRATASGLVFNCNLDTFQVSEHRKGNGACVVRPKHQRVSHYSGIVYCPQTDDGIVYVRSSGKAVWMGNTGEMNRHRAGVAISEGSMRYIRFTDIPFWMPTSLRVAVGDDAKLTDKKLESRGIFRRAFEQMQANYAELVKIWGLDDCATCGGDISVHENDETCGKFKPKDFKEKKQITSCIRRIIGMGVATGGVWTVNLRALRHILTMRTDPSAEEEIAHVWTRIGKMMIESEPRLMGDFKLDEATGCWRPEYRKV